MHRQIYHRYGIYKNLLFVLLNIVVLVCLGSCRWNSGSKAAHGKHQQEEMVLLTFHLELNPQVYQDSTWGDPPQIAIWLKNQKDQSIRTVMVTLRTAICDWVGKVECSVALPCWVAFYNRQTGTKGPPTWDNPVTEALTSWNPMGSFCGSECIRRFQCKLPEFVERGFYRQIWKRPAFTCLSWIYRSD
jgi:hypothetical protein